MNTCPASTRVNTIRGRLSIGLAICVILAGWSCGPFACAATMPLNGPWFTGAATGNNPPTGGTPSITDPNTNTFSWGTGPSSSGESAIRGVLWTYFPVQSLVNDGDALSVTFTLRVTDTMTNGGANGFRFGLFNSAGSRRTSNLFNANADPAFLLSLGYSAMWVPFANPTTASSSIRLRPVGNSNCLSTAGSSVIQTLGLGADILTGLARQASLTVTRNSATEYQVETTMDAEVLSGTTTNIVATDFDSFVLLNTPEAGRNNSIDFTDFTLRFIPGWRLVITSVDYNAIGGEITLQWNSRPDMLYNVKSSPDVAAALSTWTLVRGDVVATPPTNTLAVPLSAEPRMFFRVEELAPPGGVQERF